ncbi:pre-rRNA-processing protein TSR2 homolog [Bufo gargarizans]|uniref:pre-rRNA-processing protein TSR2 homolog n=1 Tax=Bufo gargarizans TaxID=30331 RepID=UPI001CF39458|nr:pre-rRNA-processing protein TSR2 homolog [Bufo gargarizans]
MAARSLDSRGAFYEAIQAVLGSWPVLQIAVENGFGGPHVQEKAQWMVGVVHEYFLTNADLEQYEVEETLQGMMNDEFDTMVEDGSLPAIAQQLCTFYSQCQRGDLTSVKEKIAQLSQKKYNVKEVRAEEEEEEEGSDEEGDEAMDCETSTTTASTAPGTSASGGHGQKSEEGEPEADGWTVVRRKKK